MEKQLKAGVIIKIVGNVEGIIDKSWTKKYPNWVTVSFQGRSRQVNVKDIIEVTKFKSTTNLAKGSASLCSYSK